MKNRAILITTFLLILLTACKTEEVPKDEVPTVDNPHNIIVDGKNITQANFLQKYCINKEENENCIKVQSAMALDAVEGNSPRF
jgi:hypothetical protein